MVSQRICATILVSVSLKIYMNCIYDVLLWRLTMVAFTRTVVTFCELFSYFITVFF